MKCWNKEAAERMGVEGVPPLHRRKKEFDVYFCLPLGVKMYTNFLS